MRKGDGVFYSTGSAVVRARVERMHRDGDVTVKALFYQDREGRDTPGYLGFKYRLAINDVQPGENGVRS